MSCLWWEWTQLQSAAAAPVVVADETLQTIEKERAEEKLQPDSIPGVGKIKHVKITMTNFHSMPSY